MGLCRQSDKLAVQPEGSPSQSKMKASTLLTRASLSSCVAL